MAKVISSRREIEERTGTQIKASPKGDYYPWGSAKDLVLKPRKVLVIAGEEQAVLEAFTSVRETAATGDRLRIPFIIPASAVGGMIGTGGEKVRQMEELMNATITVFKAPGSEVQVVTMWKGPEAYDKAAKWILEEQADYIDDMRWTLATTYQDSARHRRTEIYVVLSDSRAAQLIGKGGSVVKRFQDTFFVRINIEKGGRANENIVKISGLVGDVHAAHKELEERFPFEKAT